MTTDLIKAAVLHLTTPECYDQYFVKFNFFHGECMKSTLAKVVDVGIVLASVAVKVPQIMKIIKHKSGKGISLVGVSLELIAITSFFLYSYLKNFPFSAWGDGLFVGLQTAVILGLILHYKKQKMQLGLFVASYTAALVLVVLGFIPLSFMWLLQALTLPIVVIGKGAQILTNYRSRGTGQLSAMTCWLLFLGSLSRVFTSMQTTGDALIIFTFLVATTLNGIIVFQLLYYGSKSGSKKSKKEKKGKTENGKEKEKEKQKKKDNGKEKEKEKEKGKDNGKDKGKDKGKENGKDKGKERAKSKGKKAD